MATTPALYVNGTLSDQTSAGKYKLQISGDNHSLLLHYIQAAVPPTVNSASASATSLGHYQTTLVTVNVTPASGKSITSVTVGVDGLGGAGDPVTLTGPGGDGIGNWTGTFTAAGTLVAGSYGISGSVNQSDGGAAAWSVSGITVTNASPVWGGTGSDNKWSTIGNWNSGSGPAPGSGDVVAFAGSTQTTNNLDHSVSIVSLTFNSGAGSFDITNAANTLTLTSGMTNNSASAQTLDVPVALNSAQTISAAAGDIAISRAVSDSGAGFTKAGNGTLTLSGVNTFSGATTISGGALTIGGAGQLGSGTYSAAITDNGALSYNSSASQTLSGAISGTGAVTNGGSGTLTLGSGSSIFGGGVTINSGSVNVAASSTPTSGTVTSGPLGTGTVTLNGGTLVNGANELSTANNINVTAASTLKTGSGGAGYNWNLNGNLTGSGNITYSAVNFAAALRLGGDNHGYSGTFAVSGQSAAIQWVSASAGSANATWELDNTWSSSSRMGFSIGNGTINLGALSGNGLNLQNNNSGTTVNMSVGALNSDSVFSGTIVANGTAIIALTKVGTGKLILSGANTYTGTTTINAGELIGQTGGSCASSPVTVAAGATNGVKVASANGQWSCNGLTYNSGTTYADFDFGNFTPSTTTAPMSVGALTANSTVNVLLRNVTFPATIANYPLIHYTGTDPSVGSFSLISPLPLAVTNAVGGLVVDTVNKNVAVGVKLIVPNLNYMNASRTSRQIAVSDMTAAGLASSVGSPTYTVTLPSGTSANGGSVITDGSRILYTPSGSPGSDSFSYTVSDGVSSATATVTLTFQNQASGSNPEITVSGGQVVGTLYGIPGVQYDVQRSTTANGTYTTLTANLTPANPITAGADGKISFTDSAPPSGSGFYRTIQH